MFALIAYHFETPSLRSSPTKARRRRRRRRRRHSETANHIRPLATGLLTSPNPGFKLPAVERRRRAVSSSLSALALRAASEAGATSRYLRSVEAKLVTDGQSPSCHLLQRNLDLFDVLSPDLRSLCEHIAMQPAGSQNTVLAGPLELTCHDPPHQRLNHRPRRYASTLLRPTSDREPSQHPITTQQQLPTSFSRQFSQRTDHTRTSPPTNKQIPSSRSYNG